jgi:GH25 family lysozyme M1 (1,4-beta-N-acetylmuramidase)
MVNGIDVYEGDNDIQWQDVAASGERFAWIKLTEGDLVDSRATAERVSAMRHAGVIPGGYVFLRPRPGRRGDWEARFALDHARKIGLYRADRGRVKDLRFALDFEATAFPDTVFGRWKTRRYLRQAIDEVIRQLGRRPIIYSGAWFCDPQGVSARTVRGCPLWTASYTAKPIVPAAWKVADFWQFTDRGQIPGIDSKVDRNKYLLGDLNSLKAHHTI